jgi:hypothetical protein
MSPETYRDSVSLNSRVRGLGKDVFEIRLEDLHLALENRPLTELRVHFILNTAYCCSTLLSRYFELIPGCFVLKEPGSLGQLALVKDRSVPIWRESFDLLIRLLARTFHPGDLVVVKPADTCNRIGSELLECSPHATITFLMTPLRQFLLSVLKFEFRRQRMRRRLYAAAVDVANCGILSSVAHNSLTDAETIAFLWLANWFIYQRLSSGPHSSRVLFANGERLSDAPEEVLAAVTSACGLHLEPERLRELVSHPIASSYSKFLAKPYDALSRRQELAELEASYGEEADAGMRWAASHRLPQVPDDLLR